MPKLSGYEKEDIVQVIQRIWQETEENRDKALVLYDHMHQLMLQNKGDLIVISQMADKYMEQATRQTELLVRLSQVMQQLNKLNNPSADEKSKGKVITDVNALLEQLDLEKLSPFMHKEKGKTVVAAPPKTETPPQPKAEEKKDIDLEPEL